MTGRHDKGGSLVKGTEKIIIFFASGGYTGYVPVAPGTAASLAAFLVYYFIIPANNLYYLIMLAVLAAAGTFLSGEAEKILGEKDSPHIVIDEICGYLVTMAFLPKNLCLAAAGFVIFRALDIIKPAFLRKLEKIEGGMGVMIDDILSGVIGCVVLNAISLIF